MKNLTGNMLKYFMPDIKIFKKMKNIPNCIDVFCDSYDALTSAYKHGLSKKLHIYSNAPSVIMNCNNSTYLEDYWNRENLKNFQSSIDSYSQQLYDQLKKNKNFSHEESLVVLQSFVSFQKVIYKSACLTEKDLQRPILVIKVDGDGGPNGNNMNTQWDYLLQDNKELSVYRYKFHDPSWGVLNTKSVSILNRIKLGGVETIVYRVISKISIFLPKKIIKGLVLVPSENELVIEACYSLIKKFVFPVQIESKYLNKDVSHVRDFEKVKECISSIISKRINKWVCPIVSTRCSELFYKELKKNLLLFYKHYDAWSDIICTYDSYKSIVISNSMSNPSLTALSKVCTEKNIPVITTQHGITAEINDLNSSFSPVYESNYSDLFFAYNKMSKIVSDSSYYKKGESYVSGISSRHLRVKDGVIAADNAVSLVYVSNNLYTGNMNGVGNWLTDLEQCKNEIYTISNILSKLPFNIVYKTYPEDNRRYSDIDPALVELHKYKNINIIDEKVDMRFLLSDYNLIVSTTASSTLAWLILTEKPLVYIYRSSHAPLNEGAYSEFSKSIFLFNADEDGYADKIVSLLSQPYEQIILQWKEMYPHRLSMINKYVSSYEDSPGERMSRYLLDSYFS